MSFEPAVNLNVDYMARRWEHFESQGEDDSDNYDEHCVNGPDGVDTDNVRHHNVVALAVFERSIDGDSALNMCVGPGRIPCPCKSLCRLYVFSIHMQHMPHTSKGRDRV